MRNSPRLGYLTALSVDHSNNWVIVGSDLGFYTIWDLRFHIPVRSFSQPAGAGASALACAPRHTVFGAARDGTVALWDIEAATARTVLRLGKTPARSFASASASASSSPVSSYHPSPLPNIAAYQSLKLVPSEGRTNANTICVVFYTSRCAWND